VLTVLSLSCGKFQQARECGSFVKLVNSWISRPSAEPAADAARSSDAKQVAAQARATALHYAELSQSLADLHVQGEELSPRVKRYEELTRTAERTLGEVADALDRGDLEKARQKRIDFDATAEREAPLVKEINGICR
jgi:hypothetical protein